MGIGKRIQEIIKINQKRVRENDDLTFCPLCKGTTFIPGFLIINICYYCRGTGVVEKSQTVRSVK